MSVRNTNNYETIYGVTLLDDLHNYFPHLLYEPDSFLSVPDVLQYVQETTRRSFNLFDNGLHSFRSTRTELPIPQNTFQPSPIERVQRVQRVPTTVSAQESIGLSMLFPLFSMGLGTGNVRGTTAHFEDVIVHTTQEVIEEMSTQQTLIQDLPSMCTICQDNMRQGEIIRRLNVCNHEFHVSCIDNWLLNRSVICPVCRHDIRVRSLPQTITERHTQAQTQTQIPTTVSAIPPRVATTRSPILTARRQRTLEPEQSVTSSLLHELFRNQT
jgi:Ring finger domain